MFKELRGVATRNDVLKKVESAVLVVGDVTLSNLEFLGELSRAKISILKIVASVREGIFVPIIVDNSMNSHIAILAAADLGLDMAIIDSNLKIEVLSRVLEKLNSPVGIIANPELTVMDLPTMTFFTPLQREPKEVNYVNSESSRSGSVVVFSSGSTGDPKGVILPWNELFEWTKIRNRIDDSGKQAQKTILNMSPTSWVLGLMNLLSVLLGAKLVTLNPSQLTPSQLLMEIRRVEPSQFTITANLAKIVSSVAREWKLEPVESIQHFIISGGKVSWETVNSFSSFIAKTAIFNHNLSATESFRMFELNMPYGKIPTSGQVQLGAPRVAENVKLQPTGNKNMYEIYASGNIAAGYINKEKSREVFSLDNLGKLWWKSGELVRLDRDTGNYYYAGRKDNMIKVNDHNVLLDEIESLIQSHPKVKMTAVLPVEIGERTRIVAFISWNEDNSQTKHEIVEHLSKSLPNYALPHKVVSLPSFPLTRSGKTDRAALSKIATNEHNF